MELENQQKFKAKDIVRDRWDELWTIVSRYSNDAPIRYEDKEEKGKILNQTDIVKKVN